MILLDGQVNGNPAVLMLDTGADFTLISRESGFSPAIEPILPLNTPGSVVKYVKGKADLRLEKRHWIDRTVLFVNMSDVSKRLGTRVDGIVGQDLLREFSAVRIDYKAGLVEFEK